MTVYVDPLTRHGWHLRGKPVESSHLFTDGPIEELHAFAEKIGMKREWFQEKRIWHYDLTESKRKKAVAAGAVQVSMRKAVLIWKNGRA